MSVLCVHAFVYAVFFWYFLLHSVGNWGESCRNETNFDGRTSRWQIFHPQICRSFLDRGT